MPSKNIIKEYIENGYYHIYTRGVEKRDIFLDKQDCVVFFHYLRLYLSSIEELESQNNPGARIQRFIPLNLSKEIDLLSFSLMPNHIHLQIKQYTKDGIIKFMRRILTSYVMYFNKKYQRIGTLFQSTYKAARIESDMYLLHLSRYIHLNPLKVNSAINFIDFSSYPYYLGRKKASWVKPEEILSFFRSAKRQDLKEVFSYQSFVEDYLEDSSEILGSLVIEDDIV
ncbi:MAG: transposase [Candidatus Levybacteria bacterium]|nr:transposase [Candidatus Levybacteria bacterium]